MSSASGMLWGKTSRPAPRVSTLVPFIINGSFSEYNKSTELHVFEIFCQLQ